MAQQQQMEAKLIGKIIEEIINSNENKITFKRYMEMALYYPDLGYYTKDREKIGKKADFYTSSSVGSVFGQTISKVLAELVSYVEDQEYRIIEIGGGNGRFARDVLAELKLKEPDIYSQLTYFMIETSPYHIKLQEEYLSEHLDHVQWISQLEELGDSLKGVIFSNELVDAFPVHMVKKVNGDLKEIYVTWNHDEAVFEEVIGELSNQALSNYFIEQRIDLKEGQTSEINLNAIEWIQAVGKKLQQGYVMTIDYGHPAEELYASNRHNGTLMCYHQHLANDNPFQHVGDQDITTHVNFTALEKYGEQVGLQTILLDTQGNFLIRSGILEYLIPVQNFEERDLFQDQALKINRAIRQLITPGEMGDTFKVMLQQKGMQEKEYQFMKPAWEKYPF